MKKFLSENWFKLMTGSSMLVFSFAFLIYIVSPTYANNSKKEKIDENLHKKCDKGRCISHLDLYMIEEGIDDINHYVGKINSGDTTHNWLDRIVKRTKEINHLVK